MGKGVISIESSFFMQIIMNVSVPSGERGNFNYLSKDFYGKASTSVSVPSGERGNFNAAAENVDIKFLDHVSVPSGERGNFNPVPATPVNKRAAETVCGAK